MFASPQKRSAVLCLALSVAALVLYNHVSRHPFVNYDDDRYVYENAHVRAGLNWQTITWAFTTTEQANWHPLSWLSHAFDCQLFDLNPPGHHYMNLLLHAANVVLLFLLLQWATGFTWRSLAVAALFAIHPINVESVAWVSERKNLLSMLFLLLAVGAYGWYARNPGPRRYFLMALLFALGLMAKPQVITLPFILLLCDYWPLRRTHTAELGESPGCEPASDFPTHSLSFLTLEKLPLLILSAVSAIITIKAQSAGGAVGSWQEYPFPVRLENAIVSYARYLGKALWPWRLAPMYPHPGNSLAAWQVVTAALLLALITGLVITARRRRYLVTGWFWFLGTLVPMIGLVQVGGQAMADRYAYLSFVGLFVMVCWGVAEWAGQRRLPAVWLAAPSFVLLLGLALVTSRQIDRWRDNVALWSWTLQVTRDNYVAHDNLGGALLALGRRDEAMPHFQAAVAVNPLDPGANLNLAADQQRHGNLRTAVAMYQKVLRVSVDPKFRATAFSNLGSAYRDLGDYIHAKESYAAAVRLVPESAHAWIGLGLLEQRAGNFDEAARLYSRSVAVQPNDIGYLLLARALDLSGHSAEAQEARSQAARWSRDLAQAQQNVGILLSK